ncbi:MAG: PH domain-containing protein [Antricoccus sp.]
MARTAQTIGDELPVASGLGDPGRYLLPNERARVAVRRHVLVLAPAIAETIGFIAVALTLLWLFPWVGLIHTLSALVILCAAVRFGYLVLEWRMDRIVVTEQRMMVVGGVLTRRVAAIPLLKVTDLTYAKPLIGQLFGYGTFVVESAGQDQAFSQLDYLPRADCLYRQVSNLLFSDQRPGYVAVPPEPLGGSSAQLLPRSLDDTDRFALPDFDAPAQTEHSHSTEHDYAAQPADYPSAKTESSWQPRPVDPLCEQRAPRWTRRTTRGGR